MKNNYFFIIHSKKIQTSFFILLLFCITLYSCFHIKSVDHPTTAEPYSYFDVTFVGTPELRTKTEGYGFFGALIPNGWSVQDDTEYSVIFPEGEDNMYGTLKYNQEYTNKLTAAFTPPDGYHWAGYRSVTWIEFQHQEGGVTGPLAEEFFFTARIYTDDKIGDFDLRYVIATDANNEDPTSDGIHVDEERTITISGDVISDVVEIAQPVNAQTYSIMDVDISYISSRINSNGYAYFGALLPKGWRVEDYTDLKVSNQDGTETKTGRFSYEQYYTDRLERNYDTPDGYYWWGGRTIDNLPINLTNNNISLTFRIYSDNQTGNFDLRYIISAGPDNAITDYLKDETYYPVSITQGSNVPLQKETNWKFIPNDGWDDNIKYYSDKDYDGYFTRWYGWTGGDVAITTVLPDGRSIWVWGDSYTGKVDSQRARSTENAQFVRNIIITQDGEDFSAFNMINEGELGSIDAIIPCLDEEGNLIDEGKQWYWPSGGSIYYRNGIPELQVLLQQGRVIGEGVWDVETVSTDLAVFTLPDLKLDHIVRNRHLGGTPIGFSGQILKDDDGVVYIYGSGSHGICVTNSFVARVIDGDLTQDWEFYNAKTKEWSTDYSWQSRDDWTECAIAEHPLVVFKDGGKYFAIEQAPCFSSDTYIHDADSPIGPFHNRRLVGQLPEEINDHENYFCYIPVLHPQFSKNGELMYCVSKNHYFDFAANFNNPGSADTYLPYFFRVKNWRDKLNIAYRDATDNGGILTAQHEANIENLVDNDENTIYSSPSGETWVQYQSLSPITLRRYTLTSNPDDSAKDPLHWQILASVDGQSWEIIDQRYYAEFEERLQTASYTVSIEGEFNYFKINFLGSKGGGELQIAEWQMFGKYKDALNDTAEVETITVNGEELPVADEIYYEFENSSNSTLDITVITKDFATVSDVEGIEEREYNFTKAINNSGITKIIIPVVSEDGNKTKEYTLIVNRPYRFSDLVKVKWENTLMINNYLLSSYNIQNYQWYRNGLPIENASGSTYSVGPKATDKLDPDVEYHILVTANEGVLRCDPEKVEISQKTVKVYPNPVQKGQAITIDADFDDEMLAEGIEVEIYNMNHGLVQKIKINQKQTSVTLPDLSGMYILKVNTKVSKVPSLKVLVK